MDAYRNGLNAGEPAFAAKKYKSYRQVGTRAEACELSKGGQECFT